MKTSNFAILLILIIGIIEIISDILFKFWAKGNIEINWFLIIGVLIYNIIGILYAFSLRYGLLSIINSIWQGVSLLFTVLLGIFYFNERPNIKQMVCILLVFIGTIGLIFIK